MIVDNKKKAKVKYGIQKKNRIAEFVQRYLKTDKLLAIQLQFIDRFAVIKMRYDPILIVCTHHVLFILQESQHYFEHTIEKEIFQFRIAYFNASRKYVRYNLS